MSNFWCAVGIILLVILCLAIPVLSILGIVYGSMDIAHGSITTKSLCFVIFGCIGLLGGGGISFTCFDVDIW